MSERRILGLLVGFTIAAYCAAAMAYAWTFGYTLSREQSVWGEFGDFMGGAINPLAAIVTVYLLLRTYLTQREELLATRSELAIQNKHFATQARLADIKRAIEEAYGVWQSLAEPSYVGIAGLNKDGHCVEYTGPADARVRRGDLLAYPAHVERIADALKVESPWMKEMRADWERNFSGMPYILAEIETYLAEYDRPMCDEESKLTEFYRQRLSDASRTLSSMGMLAQDVAQALQRRVDHHKQ